MPRTTTPAPGCSSPVADCWRLPPCRSDRTPRTGAKSTRPGRSCRGYGAERRGLLLPLTIDPDLIRMRGHGAVDGSTNCQSGSSDRERPWCRWGCGQIGLSSRHGASGCRPSPSLDGRAAVQPCRLPGIVLDRDRLVDLEAFVVHPAAQHDGPRGRRYDEGPGQSSEGSAGGSPRAVGAPGRHMNCRRMAPRTRPNPPGWLRPSQPLAKSRPPQAPARQVLRR